MEPNHSRHSVLIEVHEHFYSSADAEQCCSCKLKWLKLVFSLWNKAEITIKMLVTKWNNFVY